LYLLVLSAASYTLNQMRTLLAGVRAWCRPRKNQSFVSLWAHNLAVVLPIWPLSHLFYRAPWHDGIGTAVTTTLCLSLGQYAYFHVYGGTDARFPQLPPRQR
jgi:hypothetical protein